MYRWIIILCLLIFFILISIKNKECFSVGGDGESNNINISSDLYLDSSMCCDNNLKCNDSSLCGDDNNCFYDPNKIKIEDNNIVYNCSGNCKNGNKTTGQLCISDTKDTIDNIMDHANTPVLKNTFLDFIKTELSNKDDILCSKENVCTPLLKNFQNWETEYNIEIHIDDNVKSICSNYQKLSDQNSLQSCAIDLNIGTCQSK